MEQHEALVMTSGIPSGRVDFSSPDTIIHVCVPIVDLNDSRSGRKVEKSIPLVEACIWIKSYMPYLTL